MCMTMTVTLSSPLHLERKVVSDDRCMILSTEDEITGKYDASL